LADKFMGDRARCTSRRTVMRYTSRFALAATRSGAR